MAMPIQIYVLELSFGWYKYDGCYRISDDVVMETSVGLDSES